MNALLPEIKAEFFHNGVPLAGGLVYFYEPGTSTPKTSYADALGAVPNSNPVVLDSQGRASIFINGFYKVVVTTALGTPVYDQDNVSASPFQTLTVSEWITSGVTPTYLSATTFSVDGDYTGLFQVGRRIRTVDVGGTDYGVVAAAVFATGITTVTVSLDSGSLDSGLASVDVGILSLTNKSLPTEPTVTKTDDYVLAKTDDGKTIIFDKATGVTATLPETSINKVFTVTIASPAVFSSTAHTFSINDAIHFTTTGALPTGLTVGTIYYIISAGFTVDAYQVSTSRGGAAVNTSGTQSGTHTAYRETAAVPNGWKVRLKDLGAGTLTITGTVDGILNPTLPQTGEMVIYSNGTWFYLDAPTRVRADGALRTFSATPAANSAVVSGSDSFLAQGWFANRPAFSAYYSGTPVTATGSFQKITLNTEEYDTNNNFDSTTNYRFTPTVAGKYLLTGSMQCQGTTTLTNIALAIYKNGTIYKREQRVLSFTAGAIQTIPITTLVDANGSTDYFELYGVIVGTGTVDYRAGIEASDTSLQGIRIF